MKMYRVDLAKEQLTFSAAHFITFGDNICERLHGHNYGVRCSVAGDLNEHGFVVDFIALRDQLIRITSAMDHRVLLPTRHPAISVKTEGNEVIARFEDRRWVFPKEDCLLLDISNTTAELLASLIAKQLFESRATWAHDKISKITVAVDENQGQWGEVEMAVQPA